MMLKKYNTILENLGTNIKLARLRRKLTLEQIAERADVSVETLLLVEDGNKDLSIETYLKVLIPLGLSDDISKIALDDVLGRKLQDIELLNKN